MKRLTVFSILFCLLSVLSVGAQDHVLLDFSGATAEENKVTLMGAGFGQYPQADVTFGAIPTDNAFENATDGRGMIVQADPGEGVMVLTQPIQTVNCALIRCSVRASASHASVYLASVDQGENTFVSTITPNNSALFVNQYKRLADFFLPPSTGFQGIIQVTNTSLTEKLTVYLDNLEILILGKDTISLDVSEITGKKSAPVATPTPTNTPTEILTPNTPIPNITNETITVNLTLPSDAKPLEMLLIPAGTFMMGSPVSEQNRDDDEGPQHQVTISQSYYLGKYEVTQAQWKAVMNSTPSYFGWNPNLPVEQVSWEDCQTFIQKLNQLGQGTFRLPTEAEWEYACRASTTTAFYWGDDTSYSQIGQYAWYWDNSGSEPHEVGTKSPNRFGLFDMSGNVYEWCQDWYGSYSSSVQTDPTGASSGSYRVQRGGGWDNGAGYCRSAFRNYDSPDYRGGDSGFRLLRSYNETTNTPVSSTPTSTNTPTPVITNKPITVDLTLPYGAKPLEMVLILAGTFMMGSPGSEKNRDGDEGPQHQVTISQSYYLGKYEVTQAQWKAVMNSTPSFIRWNPNLPVEQVSWDDCQTFIQKLNQMGQGTFRLPTEAEWEYACRASTTTAFYWGDDPSYSQIGQYAWNNGNSDAKTHEVGTKSPNGFGLFDMSGNVYEWCQDWYGSYSSSVQTDPTGASSGSNRVFRGGSWVNFAEGCRSAIRIDLSPDFRNVILGFRLLRSYP